MTDADLNALFAEHVAGYVRREGGWEIPPMRAIWLEPLNFTASMDAVLPYLEKWNESWEIAFYDGTWNIAVESPKGHMLYGWVKDKSLPRACVLALLRAAGVAV